MTTTPTNVDDAELRRRAGSVLAAGRAASFEEAVESASAELEAEAAQRAAGEAHIKAQVDGFTKMTTCVCGASRLGRRDGFCERCGVVARALEAEALAAEVLPDGRTRRQLVVAVLEARAARSG
jgi:hypothetical protein